jgi:hypothetical protein
VGSFASRYSPFFGRPRPNLFLGSVPQMVKVGRQLDQRDGPYE